MDELVERDMDRWTDCDKCRNPPPAPPGEHFLSGAVTVRFCLEDRVHADPSGHFCKRVICRHCQEKRC